MIFGKNCFCVYSVFSAAEETHLLLKSTASGSAIPFTIACAEDSFEV